MTGRLAGRVAIVTGGASGFGAGIARCFAHEGAKVLIADRDAPGGEAVAESLRGKGADAAACAGDVTDRASVASMVAAAGDAFGAVDILVANAGIGQRPSPFEVTPDETIDQLYAVNVKGVMNCCREVIPLFRDRGRGNIIVTASGIALIPRPNFAAYAASKGAVVALAKALALELASDGIRVNALCPAVGDTPMLAEFAGGEVADEARAGFGSILPLGKLITPEDVGHAAVFLASDVEAGNITGCALPVDGGRCV